MAKKNKKVATKTILLISVLAVLIIAVGIVSAHSLLKKNPNAHFSPMSGGMNKTQMNLIQNAIKNNDYTTWKSLMESQLTQENFNKLVNMTNNLNKVRQDMTNVSFSGNFSRTERFRQGNFTGNWSKANFHRMPSRNVSAS